MWNRFVSLLDLVILRVAVFLGALAIGLMMVIGTADAIGRTFFNRPLPGTSEIVEYAMGLAVFLAIPAVTRARNHVVIDLLDHVLAPAQRIQLVLADLINAAVFGLMTWQVWEQAVKASEYGDVSQMLRIPMGLAYRILAVLAGVALFTALVNLVEDLFGRPKVVGAHEELSAQASGSGP